jgi:hypothetical protein
MTGQSRYRKFSLQISGSLHCHGGLRVSSGGRLPPEQANQMRTISRFIIVPDFTKSTLIFAFSLKKLSAGRKFHYSKEKRT